MSCEIKTLITVFILSIVALHLNCRTFSATSTREGYSGESANLNRIRRASSFHRNESETSMFMYELRSNDSPSMHLDNEKSFHKTAFEVEAGFQGDAPAFGGQGISRKMYQRGSGSQSADTLPLVHCSEDVMTLKATGREYMHIFIDRVNAAPLPLLQVPAYCGYSVSVTWKDLVLMTPYDGCYIKQENGNYILSLQWWGSPIQISCPIIPVIPQTTSQPTPSVLCSQFGMAIAIEGAREAPEKHRVKVNGNILPLLSETCTYRVYSPPDVVLLHTAFNSECVTVTDGKNILTVILDGKQFTLSCHLSRFLPYLHSGPFHKPPQPYQEQVSFIPYVPAFPAVLGTVQQPTKPKPVSPKPAVIPHLSYEQPAVLQTSFPRPTYKPLIPEPQFPQIPVIPLTPSAEPPKMSPSLVCTKNRLMATLPSARMESIKVKDVKANTWNSIASVPAACKYTLHSRGSSVELSSPLPSCHTHRKSATVISLYVRFWDSSQLRLRTLQLQCHHFEDEDSQPTVPLFKPHHQIVPHYTTVHTPAQSPPKFQVVCSSQNMSVTLPPGPTSGIIVQAASSGIKTAVSILEAPSHCGYSVRRGKDGANHVLLPYSSCHMSLKDGQYRIILKYQTQKGRVVESLLSCHSTFSQECNLAPELRLVCGSVALTSSECHDRGCCYSVDTQSCYYPMDECTLDRHFVFSVHSSDAEPPFSPATLVTAGNNSCTPHKVTADLALFKIPLDECGVHRYEVGNAVIYMVEILNRVQPISLNYGTITRDSSVRLLVECRYLPGSVVSVGYLVKSPTLGPSIKAQGVFGVQLRIAKDEHYKSFYPQYHQPLHMLLGKPLYLEVRLLNPPDPTATLLVHYCVAYPRSAQSAWILIYDGCPNVLDQTPTHTPPATPPEALTKHVRRFTISTFQFQSQSEDACLQENEEIYFMCSTEVCLPSDGPCVEGCFADPSNVKF